MPGKPPPTYTPLRHLPCVTPTCQGAAAGRDRHPLIVGALAAPLYVYRCSSCRKTQRITVAQFNALPRLTMDDLGNPKSKYSKLFAGFVLDHYTGGD